MEVVLKKAKVTQSIIKQVTTASKQDLMDFKVLGWYVDTSLKKSKWILLSNDKTLSKWILFENVKVTPNSSHTEYNIECFMMNWIIPIFTEYNSFNANQTKSLLELVKSEALDQGQIFI